MGEFVCHIDLVKDGQHFVARTETEGGEEKEYKNTVFEDLLTEMFLNLQETIRH